MATLMEIGSQKMQRAASSDCWSIGSGHYPSGRFPKVSIGITVEKCPNTALRQRNEDKDNERKSISCLNAAGENPKSGIADTLERNRSDNVADKKMVSTWVSPRSVHVDIPTSETVKFSFNKPEDDGVRKKNDMVAYGRRREKSGNMERKEDAAFATMQDAMNDEGNGREERESMNKFDEKRLSDGDVERREDFAFPAKKIGEDENETDKCNNASLKMKLWEILGTATSENKHISDSPDFTQKGKEGRSKLTSLDSNEKKENVDVYQSSECRKANKSRTKLCPRLLEENKEFNKNLSREFQKKKTAQHKHNSDTIETDSESPNQVNKRPVTRSLTRKRAPPKKTQTLKGNNTLDEKKQLSSTNSDFKLNLEKKNVFAFDEVEAKAKAGSFGSSSGHSNKSNEKNNEQNKAKFELPKVYFRRSISEKSTQSSDKQQKFVSPNKPSFDNREKENSSVQNQDAKQSSKGLNDTPNDIHQPEKVDRNNFGNPFDITCSPLFKVKTHSWGHEDSPLVQKNVFLHEDNVAFPTIERKTNMDDDLHSPTLAMNMSPTSQSVPSNEILSSPTSVKINTSKELDNSSPESCQPNSDTESETDDDSWKIRKTVDVESPLTKNKKYEKQQFSFSPMEEDKTEERSESEDDDISNKDHGLPSGFGLNDKWFPTAESPKNSPLSLHKTKRARSPNNEKSSDGKPLPSSPTASEGIIGSYEASEQLPEGSLGRCFAQLALALEKIKRRMKSQTSKRSSEILSAAADKIRQQLQDVQTQMLVDMGKFSNAGKSKRKRLESKFQEEQERLRLIHDKFGEDVNQHLLKCKSVLEEIEAHNMELKGTADRQKASHRKLLLQVEGAMESQINNAEASIAAIQKDAQKKLTCLKRVLKDFVD